MRILIDTSLLVEGERRNFDLGEWVVAARHEVFICDATVAEYIAGTSNAAFEFNKESMRPGTGFASA
jgi:predicted nucleic acid-binding protein